MNANDVRALVGLGVIVAAMPARADSAPTPGFVEPIVQWGVQKGETCEDIAKALYGSATHVPLIGRYNRVVCAAGKPLPEGTTLILPKSVTTVPDARVKSSHPNVRGRPSGGSWATVLTGAPLYRNHNVQTMEEGRAHIEFLDHTHVFLAQNTLIVVYGTASNTRVSKVAPTIELQAGEVQAGLSALRGEPAVVALPEGGLVSASSRDAVIERKATRTTVAVFEGQASVDSGGQTVSVPKNFGTRFVGNTPPAPPRPLPPAPQWVAGGSPNIVLAPAGTAIVTTNWTAVAKAKAYRLEVSRDEGFHDLVVREEIPGSTLSFRAERFPAGTYRLRVRAIDEEEYLGISSDVRTIEIVAANVQGEGGHLEGGKVIANPYGMLTFDTQQGLELALDDGPFAAIPREIDLLRQAPKKLRIRTAGGKVEPIVVEYSPIAAQPVAALDQDKRILNLQVHFVGAGGVDLEKRIGPRLRVRMGERTEVVPLSVQADKTLLASFPVGDESGEVRFDVTDSRGVLLGTNTIFVPEKALPVVAPLPVIAAPVHRVPRIGMKLPMSRPLSGAGVPLSSPTMPLAAGLGIGGGVGAQGKVLQGNLRASGSIGRLGLDATIELPPVQGNYPATADYPPTENVAWLGARYRVVRMGDAKFELAPMFHIGLPMVAREQPARFDLGLAAGGVRGPLTWLVNVGGAFALGGNAPLVPRYRPYLTAGGTYDLRDWFRVYGAIDLHYMVAADARDVIPAGFSCGFEIGREYFAGLGAWVGRAESVELRAAAVGMLSLGIHLDEVGR